MSLENNEKNTAYEKLTPQRKQLVDKVMENLEKGNLFWSQGWVSSGTPESAITGKKYRGINNLFLSLIAMSENYEDNRWATFKQMEERGWTFKKDDEGKSVAKGKGATVEYFEMRDKETKKHFDRSVLDGMTAGEQQEYMDKNVYWLRKYYRVFNCSLMDGVPAKEKPQISENDRNDRAEAILSYWDKNESKIVYGGSQALALSNEKCNNLIRQQTLLIEDLTRQVKNVKESNYENVRNLTDKVESVTRRLETLINQQATMKAETVQEVQRVADNVIKEGIDLFSAKVSETTEEVKDKLKDVENEIEQAKSDIHFERGFRKFLFWATPILLAFQTAISIFLLLR